MAHPSVNDLSVFNGQAKHVILTDEGSWLAANREQRRYLRVRLGPRSVILDGRNGHLSMGWQYRMDDSLRSVRNHDMIPRSDSRGHDHRLRSPITSNQYLPLRGLRAFHNELADSFGCQTTTWDFKARCLGSNKFTTVLSDEFGDRFAVCSYIYAVTTSSINIPLKNIRLEFSKIRVVKFPNFDPEPPAHIHAKSLSISDLSRQRCPFCSMRSLTPASAATF
ncbi:MULTISPECIES: hypothetical protein [unclassified Bradyrhizobium]|uniref:hypothetical protein n=1 Tax=unclassified Bradyrhizobium TaxID=2631580 RepID=UPI0024793990|nr:MULTISPECIES: hypothetical protein [unclassified Bradyrhizobium]WGR72976.1 hypothetical protein MTX24_08910 [Bradyrhizobium sp. ISRA426]WGR77811.1 hypothetical protein MTX21_33865 [Bradyrhizobium sp. ISRA430]WGR88216.1 hypothetical protein MTX25_08915 [Bradyrhizobium sp. ISRA432]